MLHIDRGGDPGGANWFFDNLAPYALDYDLIGISYYPFWHGLFDQFSEVVRQLEKPIRQTCYANRDRVSMDTPMEG